MQCKYSLYVFIYIYTVRVYMNEYVYIYMYFFMLSILYPPKPISFQTSRMLTTWAAPAEFEAAARVRRPLRLLVAR